MKIVLTLHTSAPPSKETETWRYSPRGDHNFLEEPIPVIFEGSLYTPVPPHLVPGGYGSSEPGAVLIPLQVAAVYDVDFDEVAERLYTPTAADELVERVRVPLEQLVHHANGMLQGTETQEQSDAIAAAEKVLRELKGPARFGGPDLCAQSCSECQGDSQRLIYPGAPPLGEDEFRDRHHFSEVITSDVDEEPEHEAAKLGWEAWFACKHCPAWIIALPVEG